MKLIHVAGKPDGLVQRCTRCQRELQDYRDVAFPVRKQGMWWWPSGADILQSEDMTGLATAREKATVAPCVRPK